MLEAMARARTSKAALVVVGASWALAAIIAACGGAGSATSEQPPPAPPILDAAVDAPAPGDAGLVHAAFGLDLRPPNATCHVPARPPPASAVTFQRIFPALDAQNM